MIVLCEECNYRPYCVARLNDRMIRGCGMELYQAGLIKREEIKVLKAVRSGVYQKAPKVRKKR